MVSCSHQFLDALRLLVDLNRGPDLVGMDVDGIERVNPELQSGELREQYDKFILGMANMVEHYLQQIPTTATHVCHAVSHGFLRTWNSTPFARGYPLAITIRNVWFRCWRRLKIDQMVDIRTA